MPIRWIVFRLINYLVMLSITVFIIVVLINIGQTRSRDWITILIFFSSVGILLTNSIFNIFWLERYYPAQIPSKIFKRTSNIFFILTIIVLSFFVVALFALSFNILLSEDFSIAIEWQGMLFFILFIFTSLGGIYLLIYRNILIRVINHNQQLQFNSFLVSNT